MSNIILFQVAAIPGVAYNHTKYGDLTIHLNPRDIVKLRDRLLESAARLSELEVQMLEAESVAEAKKFEIPLTPAQVLEQRLANARVSLHAPQLVPQIPRPAFTITRGQVEEDDGELGPPPASIQR